MYEQVKDDPQVDVTKDGMIPATIKEKREVAEKTLLVDFDLLGREFPFRPGQYFHIRLLNPPYDDGRGPKRHFTIVNSPTERGIVRLTTRLRDSAFKRSLKELPIGSEVEVGKVRGEDFVLPDDTSRRIVYVSGGIGITPARSMMKYAVDRGLDYDFHVLYSADSVQSAVFLEDMRTFANRLDAELTLTITRDPSWQGEKRHIDADFIREHVRDLASPLFFVSGPPGLVDDVVARLGELGVEDARIKRQNFEGY